MREWLDGLAGPEYAAALIWTLSALLLLVVVLYLFRLLRNLAGGTYVAGGRNRKTRLAVMDATAVDSHRRLVLVRRDDVEHLLLIGGPTDVLVEQNIRLQSPAKRADHPGQAQERPPAVAMEAPRQADRASPAAPRVDPSRAAAAPAVRLEEVRAPSAPVAPPQGQRREPPPLQPAPARIEPRVQPGSYESRQSSDSHTPAAKEPSAQTASIRSPAETGTAGAGTAPRDPYLPPRQPEAAALPSASGEMSLEEEMNILLSELGGKR